MFLKRLEVIGFKSFAERIGIDFVPGVTAVVGPNGSGKSNVTDAIRWVLGEQSAKSLRGSKMEDVIFAGSDSRKPLNFAEVTLILNNEDERIAIPYTEISVTRRVYRSGDSEYLLNNQQCRLKDVTDLFMDSGLGKEAFSIISQGRVDEILNSKPDDRRVIFEEAAGVLKYKQRKKKAEHKLVETDENLHRVLDILHELDSRLEPLKIQASAARDYVQMSEELEQFDVALIVHDVTEIEKLLVQLNEEYGQLEAKELVQAEQIVQGEQKIIAVRKEIQVIDERLEGLQEQLVESTAEVERWDGRRALTLEKRSNAEKHLSKLEAEKSELTATLTMLGQQQAEKKAAFKEKQQEVQTIKQSIKQLEQALTRSVSEIEAEIENKKNDYIDLLNEEATLKNDLKHIEQQLAHQQVSAEQMSGRSFEMKQKLATLLKDRAKQEATLAEVTKQFEEKLALYEVLQSKVKQGAVTLEEKQNMLYKAYQHLHQLKTRKETLEELASDFSGFFQGVKEVLLARDRGELTGVEGAIAELIQVPSNYSLAIETALGAAMQHIVTTDEQSARSAIAWLKQKRAGRATFLPKTVMKSRKLAAHQIDAVISHPSFIDMAYALVSFQQSNRTIVENVLGNVIVAKDLKGASEIARLLGYKFRVVTIEGDIVNAGGSLTGGANKQQTSVFSRKAELDQLVYKVVELERTIETAEQTVASEKSKLEQLRHEMDEVKLAGDTLRTEQQQLKANVLEISMEQRALESNVSLTSSEQSSMSTREDELLANKEQLHKRLAKLTEELTAINELVEQLTSSKAQSETEKDVLREQLGEYRSNLAVVGEQLSQIQVATAELQLQMSKIEESLNTISQEISWMQSDDGLQGHSLEEIDAQIQGWTQKRDEATTTIADLRQQKDRLQVDFEKFEADLKELQRTHKGFVDAINAINIKRNRAQVEQTNLLSNLEEHYDVTYEFAKETAVTIEDVEQVRRKVKLLKTSIEELGPVNLTAIEEFERVQERHSFLTEQRNDLLQAKETLLGAIEEMDEEMSTRFGDTFTKVRAQFKKVFRELFGGGQADLVLINPENLLETGIEIIAQPPGKKAQSLSLLSGGERALTAIALLFAILNTRPVPFCILDEVEAALDESNVLRYSQYLKRFSHETQFIVITHRKGTMEGADVLYGITMQESGVSKLVSVKLEEEPVLAGN